MPKRSFASQIAMKRLLVDASSPPHPKRARCEEPATGLLDLPPDMIRAIADQFPAKYAPCATRLLAVTCTTLWRILDGTKGPRRLEWIRYACGEWGSLSLLMFTAARMPRDDELALQVLAKGADRLESMQWVIATAAVYREMDECLGRQNYASPPCSKTVGHSNGSVPRTRPQTCVSPLCAKTARRSNGSRRSTRAPRYASPPCSKMAGRSNGSMRNT